MMTFPHPLPLSWWSAHRPAQTGRRDDYRRIGKIGVSFYIAADRPGRRQLPAWALNLAIRLPSGVNNSLHCVFSSYFHWSIWTAAPTDFRGGWERIPRSSTALDAGFCWIPSCNPLIRTAGPGLYSCTLNLSESQWMPNAMAPNWLHISQYASRWQFSSRVKSKNLFAHVNLKKLVVK